MSIAAVYGPEAITLEGRHGQRYWVHAPYSFTGNAAIDERLSGYPVAVFQAPGRPVSQTPLVVGLQGMAAPYQWNGFLIPTLLDMGIGCILFDSPLAGERSLARKSNGNILSEVVPLLERGLVLQAVLIPRLMDAVARDFNTVLTIVRERHGLQDSRVALFGVSLGTLLASYAFMRDGIGCRLLGTLGHADLYHFARSYTPPFTPLIVSQAGRALGKLASLFFGRVVHAGIGFLTILQEICSGGNSCIEANPMTFAERVTADRRVRFLVGLEDALVKHTDATACARRFPGGESYAVPGLGHGISRFGPSFVEHVRTFIGTQLSDWKW